jgi:transcription antitermination protein NusB
MMNAMTPMIDIKDTKPEILLDGLNTTPLDVELSTQELAQALAEQEQQEESELFNEDFLYNIKPDSRRNERILSFCLIYAADRSEYTNDLEDLMQNLRDGYSIEVAHNTFITTLVQGVIATHEQLDERIKPYLKNWKLERLGCCTRLILRMALWELSQEGAIPSVVMNEAIELAKMFAERDAYKFVNGILDEIVKKAYPSAEVDLAVAVELGDPVQESESVDVDVHAVAAGDQEAE